MSVLLQTSVGELVIDLFTEDCPFSSFNFLKLSKAKFYNNVAFHRIEKNFLARAGAPSTADPRWNLSGGLGALLDETKATAKREKEEEAGRGEGWGDRERRAKERTREQGTGEGRRRRRRPVGEEEDYHGCSIWGVQTLVERGEISLSLQTDVKTEEQRVLFSSSLSGGERREDGSKREREEVRGEDDGKEKKEGGGVRNGKGEEGRVSSLPPLCPVKKEPHDDTEEQEEEKGRSRREEEEEETKGGAVFSASPSPSSNSSSQARSNFSSGIVKKELKEEQNGRLSLPSSASSSSYYNSVDFSSVCYPPFPSASAIPNLPSARPEREPETARFCPDEGRELKPLRHLRQGVVGWVPCPDETGDLGEERACGKTEGASLERRRRHRNTSVFYLTLREKLDFLDGRNLTIFGQVGEGLDVLQKLSQTFVDENFVPLSAVRIIRAYVLEDPFDDPPFLSSSSSRLPLLSPLPLVEEVLSDDGGEDLKEDEVLVLEKIEKKEAEARKVTLEIIGDLPEADAKPPENVLFIAKLNPVTQDDDLETVFSRFGEILSCDIIRDWKTGRSLQFAFITFKDKSACELAYFKMQNVLIDDRRIHVDFSQSVAKEWRNYRRYGSKQKAEVHEREKKGESEENGARPVFSSSFSPYPLSDERRGWRSRPHQGRAEEEREQKRAERRERREQGRGGGEGPAGSERDKTEDFLGRNDKRRREEEGNARRGSGREERERERRRKELSSVPTSPAPVSAEEEWRRRREEEVRRRERRRREEEEEVARGRRSRSFGREFRGTERRGGEEDSRGRRYEEPTTSGRRGEDWERRRAAEMVRERRREREEEEDAAEREGRRRRCELGSFARLGEGDGREREEDRERKRGKSLDSSDATRGRRSFSPGATSSSFLESSTDSEADEKKKKKKKEKRKKKEKKKNRKKSKKSHG